MCFGSTLSLERGRVLAAIGEQFGLPVVLAVAAQAGIF